MWQPRHYNWLKKMIRKCSFFENVLLLSISRNFLQTASLNEILLENFKLWNSIISVKDIWGERLTTMLVILEIKVSLVTFKKSLYHCDPPYIRQVSSHRVLTCLIYLKSLSSYFICIIYLHLIEACLKVTIAIFYFCHSKNSSDVMKNIFNSISIYSWKKFPC